MSRLCLFQLLESFKKSTMKVNEQDAAVHTADKSEDSQKNRWNPWSSADESCYFFIEGSTSHNTVEGLLYIICTHSFIAHKLGSNWN